MSDDSADSVACNADEDDDDDDDDALVALLSAFTRGEGRCVEALDVHTWRHLESLAGNGVAWEAFIAACEEEEPLLASQLVAWRARRGFDAPHAMRADVSLQVLDAWSAPLEELPAIEGLARVMESPLGRALPFPSSWAGMGFLPDADVAVEEAGSSVMPELHSVLCAIFALKRYGTSEACLHHFYDSLIAGVLGVLQDHVAMGLQMDRGTLGKSGPDFLCWLPSGVLAFKGEEEATGEDLPIARADLCTKLAVWSATYFGEMPYQLAYAAGGEMIQFFALDLKQNGRIVPLCDAFTVSTPRGRGRCVRMAVNLFRVLRTLHARHPGYCISLGRVVKKSDSCVVAICGHYVEKRATACTGSVLVDLYDSLLAAPIKCLARPKESPRYGGGSLTVKIQPVGFFRDPCENVQEAARAVLTALCGLHARGWVHRDVRGANILEVPGDGWYLMDLEWAERVGKPLGDYRPKRENTPPEVGLWSSAADMWQFGRVLELWEERASPLGDLGRQLCAALLAENPANRPTAEQALKHPWFC